MSDARGVFAGTDVPETAGTPDPKVPDRDPVGGTHESSPPAIDARGAALAVRRARALRVPSRDERQDRVHRGEAPWGLLSRSLYARVVSATMLLGLIVSMVLGWVLYRQIADGLVATRVPSSQLEAAAATSRAQASLAGVSDRNIDALSAVATDTVRLIASPGDDQSRHVVLVKGLSNDQPPSNSLSPRASGLRVDYSMVPMDLRAAVDQDPGYQQVRLITLPGVAGGPDVPTVLVGARLTIPQVEEYDLYIFFPMEREQEMLGVVEGAFGVGLVALTMLVGAVAALATRMAVNPIRRAADASQRLASGDLGQRLAVGGAEDLAVLARSFNLMADRVQSQIKELEELSAVQQRFVSDVSHELRTPLTTIRMAGSILHDAKGEFDPVAGRSVEILNSELERFDLLLADLLEISRFDAGAATLELESTDVREIVATVLRDVAELAANQDVALEFHPGERPCEAPVDARRISRIVRNLVANAIEHGEGRPVHIEVYEERHALLAPDASAQAEGEAPVPGVAQPCVAVAVSDSGVGLNEEQMALVFDRFWRADPSRRRTIGGSGLGLAISQEDARLHGGLITVDGAIGEGATFILHLPASVPKRGETP